MNAYSHSPPGPPPRAWSWPLAWPGAAVSAGNAVEERQATMKQVGQTMKEAAAFTAAATPFDAAKVKAADGHGRRGDAKKLKGLYPAGSASDPKTAADPKIWQNKADFDKRLAEMGTAGDRGRQGHRTPTASSRPSRRSATPASPATTSIG